MGGEWGGGAQACKALQVIAVYKIKEERKKRGKTATFLCSDTKSSYEIRLIKGVLWRRPFFPTSREPCLWALLIAFMWQVIFLHLRRSPNNSTRRSSGGGRGGLGFSGTDAGVAARNRCVPRNRHNLGKSYKTLHPSCVLRSQGLIFFVGSRLPSGRGGRCRVGKKKWSGAETNSSIRRDVWPSLKQSYKSAEWHQRQR